MNQNPPTTTQERDLLKFPKYPLVSREILDMIIKTTCLVEKLHTENLVGVPNT